MGTSPSWGFRTLITHKYMRMHAHTHTSSFPTHTVLCTSHKYFSLLELPFTYLSHTHTHAHTISFPNPVYLICPTSQLCHLVSDSVHSSNINTHMWGGDLTSRHEEATISCCLQRFTLVLVVLLWLCHCIISGLWSF
jgi:hypothetical protein